MWHNPGCGCCLEWGKRMEAAFRRKLPVIEAADLAAIKRVRGVPADLESCHTALVHGYVIEGHVPPADIQRLIRSKSRIVRGLAVAGMPAGSPGMDVGHNQRQPYKVMAFGAGGRRSVFASHGLKPYRGRYDRHALIHDLWGLSRPRAASVGAASDL
jgi:hypothetical protein